MIDPEDYEPVPGTETAPPPPEATSRYWLAVWGPLDEDEPRERWRRDLAAAFAAGASPVEREELLKHLRSTLKLSMRSLREEAEAIGTAARGDNITPAATHHRHALNVLLDIEGPPGRSNRAVNVGGTLWQGNETLWRELYVDHTKLAPRVPTMASGVDFENNVPNMPKLSTLADYDAIAKLVFRMRQDDPFFDKAPRGFAAGGQFYTLRDGRVTSEPLALKHRQRHELAMHSVPDAALPTPLWDGMLRRALTPSDTDTATFARALGVTIGYSALADEQIETLHQFFGLALLRMTVRYAVACVLVGASQSGKSVTAAVVEACFPKHERGNSNPTLWDDRRHLLALHGKALNVITELDADRKIPAAQFKAITSGEAIEAYRLYHGPVVFCPVAAHLFIGNETPRLKDDSDAAWNRLRVVQFFNTMPEAERDRDLATKIIAQELPGVIGKALAAAERAVAAGYVARSKIGDAALRSWREENNDVLEFIHDTTAVVLTGDDADRMTGKELHDAYVTWCRDNQKRTVLGPRQMNKALRQSRTAHKLRDALYEGVVVWRGVKPGRF